MTVKTIYYVDVGNMPAAEARAYIDKHIKQYKAMNMFRKFLIFVGYC